MLKDRTEELWFAHGIDENKTHVIGIEICGEEGVWPTGKANGILKQGFCNRLSEKFIRYKIIQQVKKSSP